MERHDQEQAIVKALLGDEHQPPALPVPPDPRPRVVLTNKSLNDISQDILQVLQATNTPPALFIQAGRLVRLRRDEHGQPWIEPLSDVHLRRRLVQVADVVHVSHDGEKQWHTFPSLTIMRDILAMDAWPFPVLTALTAAPIVRPNGSLLDTPGYDAVTGILYTPPPGFRLVPIPAEPSSHDVQAALALITEPLEGFPFIDEAAKANTLALLLTPLLRHAITGPVPLALIDAPQAGTGKSLLARVIALTPPGVLHRL